VAGNAIAMLRGRVQSHTVFVVNTPVRRPTGEWDFCDGCPDAMLWKGRLIPSCMLERAKAGENVPTLHELGAPKSES
jgi:hypothetical protein